MFDVIQCRVMKKEQLTWVVNSWGRPAVTVMGAGMDTVVAVTADNFDFSPFLYESP